MESAPLSLASWPWSVGHTILFPPGMYPDPVSGRLISVPASYRLWMEKKVIAAFLYILVFPV
ncbi:MAG: hypothetical protein LUO90_01355, partial [Methanoregula sp.]|nr:hypothetical protein [Methanoregula sp.]